MNYKNPKRLKSISMVTLCIDIVFKNLVWILLEQDRQGKNNMNILLSHWKSVEGFHKDKIVLRTI